MFCSKCGNELPEGAAFCGKCGAKAEIGPSGSESAASETGNVPSGMGTAASEMGSMLSEAGNALSETETASSEMGSMPPGTGNVSSGAGTASSGKKAEEKKPGGKKPLAAIIAAAAAVAAVAVGVILFLVFRGGIPDGEESLEADGKPGRRTEEAGEGDGENGPDAGPEEPLYDIADVYSIDIHAINVTPGEKAAGITWDRSLFYWLEDVDQESPEDGYLAKCRISKALLRDSESGGLIQYEVYRDPATSEIYKIVSIQEKEGALALTDYYYRNGIPNFIFAREDSIYTPTYATTDKTGERYYFADNVMARWRVIQIPGEIGEYTLTLSDAYYNQMDYFQEDEGLRKIYDDVESRMLNAAYNTYNAILSQTPIGLAEGVVRDTAGAGIGGVTVEIRRKGDNVLLYRTVTGEDGSFRCFVYLDGTECVLSARGEEAFRDTAVYGIFLADSGLTGAYGNLVLHRVDGDEYPVHINIYTAEDVKSGEDGSLSRNPLSGAGVTLREGAGAYEGEAFRTLQAGEGGTLDTALPSGVYTAQIDVPGYSRTFLEIWVDERETSADSYLLPALEEGRMGVVLTWEGGETDLDLTLFTPFQSAGGDMARVGGRIMDDGNGNRLLSDNSAGCEVLYVNTAQAGSYKIYVNDYTDIQAGNYTVNTLAGINIHIYLYDSNGFVAEYVFPAGQTGVVWEVAEISGSQITPGQRVYSRMEGKSWWLESKEMWMAEEDERLREVLKSEDSDLRDLIDALLHNLSEQEIQALIRGEQEGMEALLELNGGETPAAGDLRYVREIQSENQGELFEKSGGRQYFLSEEQVEYLLSAICGKRVDYDLSTYNGWIAPYIGFGSAAGDISVNRLDNISVERIEGGMWKVRGYNVYNTDYAPSRIMSRVCFTIARNSNSCFDGYSLIGFEVEEKADTGWARAYYDYLTKDPEGIALIENFESYWQDDTIQNYSLIYVDDDLIPEIYIEGGSYVVGDVLLHYSGEKISTKLFYSQGGEYGATSGLMRDNGGHQGLYYIKNYKLENGRLIEIGQYSWEEAFDDNSGEYGGTQYESYTLDGSEVTKEQYEETINSYFGGVELQPCVPSYGRDQDILSYLEDIIR